MTDFHILILNVVWFLVCMLRGSGGGSGGGENKWDVWGISIQRCLARTNKYRAFVSAVSFSSHQHIRQLVLKSCKQVINTGCCIWQQNSEARDRDCNNCRNPDSLQTIQLPLQHLQERKPKKHGAVRVRGVRLNLVGIKQTESTKARTPPHHVSSLMRLVLPKSHTHATWSSRGGGCIYT